MYITCQNAKIPDPELELLKYWSTSFSNETCWFDGVTGFRPRMSFDDGLEDEDLAAGRFDGLLSA